MNILLLSALVLCTVFALSFVYGVMITVKKVYKDTYAKNRNN